MRSAFFLPCLGQLLALALLACSESSSTPVDTTPAIDASSELEPDSDSSESAPPEDSKAEATPQVDAPLDSALEAGVAFEVTVYAHVDLPRTQSTQGLSATAFDLASRTLYALQDSDSSIVPLIANADYTAFTPGTPISLTGRPSTPWDGEGLALFNNGFVAVTEETTPLVERFNLTGAWLGAVAIPAIFAQQRSGNKGLESLALSPSGKYLFTANEQALEVDGAGPTKQLGSIVRIARLSPDTGEGTQHAWRTEPLGPGTGGDMGVSDIAALDDDTLLVLERGYQSDYGCTVRIFRGSLVGAADVSTLDALTQETAVIDKKLVVDFVTLPADGFENPGKEPTKLLENYEALALGPELSEGRRLLFVTSDDNAKTTQVPRVLVLALRGL